MPLTNRRVRMKRSHPIAALILLALTVLISSCKQPSSNGNANAPSPPAGPQGTTVKSPSPPGPHCGDSPPVNPANCKLNVDQPFNPGCNVPFSGGQSHDIDLHCPNDGCAKNENDKGQNRVKNNLCASGTPTQIGVASIDKLQ